MPAFGKEGIVNINPVQSRKTYQLVKPDGQVVVASSDKKQIEDRKESLSQELKCELSLVEKDIHLI